MAWCSTWFFCSSVSIRWSECSAIASQKFASERTPTTTVLRSVCHPNHERKKKIKYAEEEKWTQLHFEYSEFQILSQTFWSSSAIFSLHVRRAVGTESNAHEFVVRITVCHWSSPYRHKPIRFFRFLFSLDLFVAIELEPHSTTQFWRWLFLFYSGFGRNHFVLRPFKLLNFRLLSCQRLI